MTEKTWDTERLIESLEGDVWIAGLSLADCTHRTWITTTKETVCGPVTLMRCDDCGMCQQITSMG